MTEYTIDTFKEGDKAFYVSKRKEVEVVKSEVTDDMLVVTIKGFDEANPERTIRMCPVSPKGVMLKPLDSKDEEIPAVEEDKSEEESKAEEAVEETDTDSDPLLVEWRRIGLSEDLYHTLESDAIAEIIRRNKNARTKSTKPGRRASSPDTGKLNVILGKSEYLDAVDWLEKHWRAIGDNEDEDQIVRELFEILALVPHACQYSGDVRKTRAGTVSDKATDAITMVYERLITAYPHLLKYNLVKPGLLGE